MITQSLAGIVGSVVLAGCLGSPNIVSLTPPTDDQAEEVQEDEAGESTKAWYPRFLVPPEAGGPGEAAQSRLPGVLLAGSMSATLPGVRQPPFVGTQGPTDHRSAAMTRCRT